VESQEIVLIHVKNGKAIQEVELPVIAEDIQVHAKIDANKKINNYEDVSIRAIVMHLWHIFIKKEKIMKTIRYIVFYICILLFISCKKDQDIIKQFPIITEIEPTFVPINEIIKIGSIHKLDNYIILRNIDQNAEYFFYVYSYPNFKYLYSFCPRGNGPEEYLMPSVIKNTPQNTFSFRDHATDQFVTYQLSDSSAHLIDKFYFRPDETHFFWEMNYIDKDIYLLKRNNSKSSYRELWDLSSKTKLCNLPNTFNLEKEMGNEYYTEFDDVWISSNSNKMVFAYFFINRIEFGTVCKNKIEIESHIGTNKHPKFYTFKKGKSGGKYEYNVDYNIVYYEFITCSNNYIYALFANKPWGELEKKHSSIIEIYDWKGRANKLLHLKQNISSFIVDDNEHTLYAINPDENEDVILKYQIK